MALTMLLPGEFAFSRKPNEIYFPTNFDVQGLRMTVLGPTGTHQLSFGVHIKRFNQRHLPSNRFANLETNLEREGDYLGRLDSLEYHPETLVGLLNRAINQANLPRGSRIIFQKVSRGPTDPSAEKGFEIIAARIRELHGDAHTVDIQWKAARSGRSTKVADRVKSIFNWLRRKQ